MLDYDKNVTSRLEDTLKKEYTQSLSFSPNSVSLLQKRYLVKDEKGNIQETPKDLLARVAVNIAYADFNYDLNESQTYNTAKEFYEMMAKKDFMPNSPTLMNAGRSMQQLAACFVVPIEDNMNSILQGMKDAGMIHKSGGGTGFSFSRPRRKNAYVSTTYGKASGPISFMSAYDGVTESVNQGGFRRGANFGGLRVDHPDVLEFIRIKADEKSKKLSNFNLSVFITDDFMRALENDEYYYLKNPNGSYLTLDDILADENGVKIGLINEKDLNYRILNENGEIKVIDNFSGEIYGKVKDNKIALNAKRVFNEITKYAWNNGEPGVIFIDTINKYNPTPKLGAIESTNPCGEQPLLPYEACNLGSINLENFVKEGKIDYERLSKVASIATHFLDNVIDMSEYPLEKTKEEKEKLIEFLKKYEIEKSKIEQIIKEWSQSPIEKIVKENRKIGLGVMGFTDMLIKLDIPYDSEKAVQTAENVMKFIKEEAKKESYKLAKERGVFPNFEDSIFNDGKEENKLRNATLTTIAPTGSIGIIADVFSRGIEPLHELIYIHKDSDGQKRKYVNESLKQDLIKYGINPQQVLRRLENGEKLQDMPIPNNIKRLYVTTNDIETDYHIKIQAAFQKYTDNAVSKTVNFPFTATIDDFVKAYIEAHKAGCKGITAYRKGSREDEVITSVSKKGLEEKLKNIPKIRPAFVREETVGQEQKVFLIPTYVDGEKRELFGTTNYANPDEMSLFNSLLVRISKDLRKGLSPQEIADDIKNCNLPKEVGGWNPIGDKSYYNSSIPEAISKTLTNFKMDIDEQKVSHLMKELEKELNKFKDKEADNKEKISKPTIKDKPINLCSECNEGTIINIEGCLQCNVCGHSPKGCS
ncbi:MAG: adenosylcobalamin-dependent ribonucleoside-diphosphate reductase [Candidatus Woesearchaeota archaeon]|nr:adenosylcobalamin-dependent ribonucleoside-diphosphate reductase [Candidatus Woesearchaeota archaeon]